MTAISMKNSESSKTASGKQFTKPIVQTAFEKRLVDYGKEVMANIPKNCRPVVLLGRPYNSTDPHLNLGLVEKLITQNVMPIPVDMLDLSPLQYFHQLQEYVLAKWSEDDSSCPACGKN